jgi:hypothetical protein
MKTTGGIDPKVRQAPEGKRFPCGWLKYGNKPFDLRRVKRCRAKLRRRGTPCGSPAMKNGRCRLHGGLSTGAKTPEGRERARKAPLKHGLYSAAAIAERKQFRETFKDCRGVVLAIKRVFWEKVAP